MDEAVVGGLGQKGHSVPQPHGHVALYRIIARLMDETYDQLNTGPNDCSATPAEVTHSTPEGPSFQFSQ